MYTITSLLLASLGARARAARVTRRFNGLHRLTSQTMGDVCRQCLEARSDQIELLTKPCLELDKHDNADLLQASLTWDGRIKKVRRCHSGLPIREMPRAFFKGKFKICFGKSRCRGEACTYAHNKAELESWNKKLLGSLHTTFKVTMYTIYYNLQNKSNTYV